MGRTFAFTCADCGYDVDVSGGSDSGMRFSTQTITCTVCKELTDVVTGEGFKRDLFTAEDDALPVCSRDPSHRIAAWAHPGFCPKCGGDMVRGQLAMLWD